MTKWEKEIFDNYQTELFNKFMRFDSSDVDSIEYKIAYEQLKAVANLRLKLFPIE